MYPDVDAESVKRVDEEIAKTRVKLADAQTDAKELGAQSGALGTTLPVAEIERRIAALEKKTAAQQAKIEALRGGGEQVSRASFVAAEQALARVLKAWRQRKKIAKEMVDDVSELTGQKPSELREEYGIEDDVTAGVDIATFAKYEKPAATGKRGAPMGSSAQAAKKK
jgi:uncharacterized coiled-coil protein SlyX